jgi:uncharacterized protein YjdB
MRSTFARFTHSAIRWLWIAPLPTLIVCSSDTPTGGTDHPPAAVSDLNVDAIALTSATLSFTQVDDGTGQPASYDVRFAVAPMSWSAASPVATGTCATPVAGTSVGGKLTCSVLGLTPATQYDFQVVAFRGALDGTAVVGGASNMASAATPAQPPVVATITVTPSPTSIAVGATVALQATLKDASGNVISGPTVNWSSSNTAIATVNGSGVVSGVAAGTVTVTASAAGKSGTGSVTITAVAPPPPVVTTVTVAPSTASVVAGSTTTLTATVKDASGNVMSGQTVVWSTSNSAAATVNSSGVVSGVAAGSATITATCSGKSGTAAVTVTAQPAVVTTVTVSPGSASVVAGATTTLTAVVKDAQGNVMTGQTVSWSTNNSAAATVSSSGVVTGVAAGTATITATSSGKSGSSTITVTAVSGGGTLLFQENFEDANLASRGWYDNTGAVLSTVEHVAGSASSAQYRFLAGATTPTSGNAQRHKFTPTSSFYLSYYVKYSSNWVGSTKLYHPHEFQVMSTLDGDWDGPSNGYMVLYVEQNYQNGGKPRLAMQDNKSVNTTMGAIPNNLVGVTENRSTGGCNGMSETNMFSECFDAGGYWYNDKQLLGPVVFQPNPGAGYKNDWNFVEAYFQLNTVVNGIGQPDGVMQYWFNGALILDRHDILYRTGAHPTLQFNQFIIAPYIGDGSPVDQSMFIDNLRVGTARLP